MSTHFGEHLTIDGYQGDQDKLDNKDLVLLALNQLPTLIGMQKLSEPQVFYAKGNDKKDPGGWSGFVVIMESHISIHTFPKKNFVSIDIYTCRNGLDKEFILQYFKDIFSLQELEVNFIVRGKKYGGQ